MLKRKIVYSIVVFLFCSSLMLNAQISQNVRKGLESITIESVKGEMYFLASDLLEGRETASRGLEIAADYVSSLFKMWGVLPAGDPVYTYEGRQRVRKESYVQIVDMIEYEVGDENYLHVKSTNPDKSVVVDKYTYRSGFSFSTYMVNKSFKITAPVVFVGYGICAEELGFCEFHGVDVKDKIVVAFSGIPASRDTSSAIYKKFSRLYGGYEGYMKRLEDYKQRGALAILQISPPLNDYPSPTRNWVVNQKHNNPPFREWYEGDKPFPSMRAMKLIQGGESNEFLPMFTLSEPVIEALFANSGIDIRKAQKKIDETGEPASGKLTGKEITINVDINTKVVKTGNVLGYIEGSDPVLKEELIVIGAHYDHLGKYGGYVFNGANDNASGTIGVIETAKAFVKAGKKPKRSVLFACWTGEEKGLLGSYYFTDHPFKPIKNMVLNINMDMIAANNDGKKENANHCFSSIPVQVPELKELVETNNESVGLDLEIRERNVTRGGSDHVPFAVKKIPFIYFAAGGTDNYHQPSDSVEKLNYEKLVKVAKLCFLNAWTVANMDNRFTWDDSKVKE